MAIDVSDGIRCNTCNELHAEKALICPHCGVLARPNYAVVLVTTGVWFFSLMFGCLALIVWFITTP